MQEQTLLDLSLAGMEGDQPAETQITLRLQVVPSISKVKPLQSSIPLCADGCAWQ